MMDEILSNQRVPLSSNQLQKIHHMTRSFSYFTVIVVANAFTIYIVYNCNVLYKIDLLNNQEKQHKILF